MELGCQSNINVDSSLNDGGYNECKAYAEILCASRDDMIVQSALLGENIRQNVTVAVFLFTKELFAKIVVYDLTGIPDELRGGKIFGCVLVESNLPQGFMTQFLEHIPSYPVLNENGFVRTVDTEIIKFYKDTLQGFIDYKEQVKKHLRIVL